MFDMNTESRRATHHELGHATLGLPARRQTFVEGGKQSCNSFAAAQWQPIVAVLLVVDVAIVATDYPIFTKDVGFVAVPVRVAIRCEGQGFMV
jgi:hypothetical protein